MRINIRTCFQHAMILLDQIKKIIEFTPPLHPIDHQAPVQIEAAGRAKVAFCQNIENKTHQDRFHFFETDIFGRINSLSDLMDLLHHSILSINSRAKEKAVGSEKSSGSTLVGCVKFRDHLVVFNVGDSCALLVGEKDNVPHVRQLTREHNFFDYAEYQRVSRLGGKFALLPAFEKDRVLCTFEKILANIEGYQTYQDWVSQVKKRIISDEAEEIPRLSCLTVYKNRRFMRHCTQSTRGMGDFFLHPYMCADPAIVATLISSPSDSVLLCSDGVTDVLSSTDIAKVLRSYPNPDEFARALVGEAKRKHVTDDITAMMIPLASMKEGEVYFVCDGHTTEEMAEYIKNHFKVVLEEVVVQEKIYHNEANEGLMAVYESMDQLYHLLLREMESFLKKLFHEVAEQGGLSKSTREKASAVLKAEAFFIYFSELEKALERKYISSVVSGLSKILEEIQHSLNGLCDLTTMLECYEVMAPRVRAYIAPHLVLASSSHAALHQPVCVEDDAPLPNLQPSSGF